jgi:putative oxidoreductase
MLNKKEFNLITMRKLFNTNYNHQNLDFALLILRIAISIFMLTHGLSKLNGLLDGGVVKFMDPIGVGMLPSLILAIFAEVFCSIFLIFGFATRLAVIPLIITMIIAIFIAHAGQGFEKQETAAHYLLVYVFLFISGSGKLSVDYLISRKFTKASRRY